MWEGLRGYYQKRKITCPSLFLSSSFCWYERLFSTRETTFLAVDIWKMEGDMASQGARDEHVDSWYTHVAVLFVDEPKATEV